jgi:hypothetical protein
VGSYDVNIVFGRGEVVTIFLRVKFNEGGGMGINDFVKSCITRPDGQLLCWDNDAKQYVAVEMKRTVVSITDITEAEIISLKKKVDADRKES